MIVLPNPGQASADWDGEHIRISVPSGKDTLEVALSLRDSEMLHLFFIDAIAAGWRDVRKRNAAAVVAITDAPRRRQK